MSFPMIPGSSVLREKLVPSRAHRLIACDSSVCEFVKMLEVGHPCVVTTENKSHDYTDMMYKHHMIHLKMNFPLSRKLINGLIIQYMVTMSNSLCSQLFNSLHIYRIKYLLK